MDDWCFINSVERAGYTSSGCFIKDAGQTIFGYRMLVGNKIITRIFDINKILQSIAPDEIIKFELDDMYRNARENI